MNPITVIIFILACIFFNSVKAPDYCGDIILAAMIRILFVIYNFLPIAAKIAEWIVLAN